MKWTLARGPMVLGGFLLAGCTASGDDAWKQDRTPRSQMQQDLAECKYDAERSTATIGTGHTPKKMSDAIGEGIGDGVVKGIEQSNLVNSCMNARGYSR